MYFPRIFLLAACLLVCAVDWSCCLKLELFSNQSYKGFIEKRIVEFKDEKKCTKLDKLYDVRSLKTDKCVMLYETEDCTRLHLPVETPAGEQLKLYSVRVEKTTNHFKEDQSLYEHRKDERGVRSFHVCGELGGGSRLDVEFFSGYGYNGDTIKSWKGVCNCENIPMVKDPRYHGSTHYMSPLSVDNHGNGVYVYFAENCEGKPLFIPPGDTMASRLLPDEDDGSEPKLRSFRPGDDADCIKLAASIYKCTFSNGSQVGEYQIENVQMSSTQTLINEGALPMTQAIQFSKTVGNTAEFTVAKAFTYIHSAGVKASVATESKAGVPFVFGAKLKLSLEANYQYTKNQQDTGTNRTSHTESETVSVTTTVQVAAGERCEVTGFIKVAQNFTVLYTAEAFVTGMSDDDKMLAEEIKANLPPGMEYIKDYDEFTVQVKVQDTMKAEFAMHTFVSKVCQPIKSICRDSENYTIYECGETVKIYEVPHVGVCPYAKNFFDLI